MAKVINSTRVKTPANQSLDFSFQPTDEYGRNNEAVSSNPNGRDLVDKNRRKEITKLLKCKKTYIVSVMNLTTLRNEIAQKELIANFTKKKLDILGIVDHKIVHENSAEFH